MEITLSHDADYLLCSMYGEYRARIKNRALKEDAKLFGGAEIIQQDIVPEWPVEDISETSRELSNVQFLDALYADDELTESMLTPAAIVYMENRFANNASALLDTLSKLRSIIF